MKKIRKNLLLVVCLVGALALGWGTFLMPFNGISHSDDYIFNQNIALLCF